MIEPSKLRELAEATFTRIRDAFPNLSMDVDRDHPHVDIMVSIPKQAGMDLAVCLTLQADELHLNAGAFWLEWFPCTKAEVRDAYVEAVSGLLSGAFRILETCSGQQVVRAELQRRSDGGWQTIGTTRIGFAFSWRRSTRVLQNSRT